MLLCTKSKYPYDDGFWAWLIQTIADHKGNSIFGIVQCRSHFQRDHIRSYYLTELPTVTCLMLFLVTANFHQVTGSTFSYSECY